MDRDKDISQQFARLRDEVHKKIIGNEEVIEMILITIFSGAHIILESVPGMGKTVLTKVISETLDCDFKRVQCTPETGPSDAIGKVIIDDDTGEKKIIKGPVFTNLLLVDEINRAKPTMQAGFLEVMEEKRVTLGGISYPLPDPFIMIATENPIEQAGVYPLPEAQKDRFLFKLLMKYLTREEEAMIAKSVFAAFEVSKIFNRPEILIIQREIRDTVTIKDSVLDYAIRIVEETRKRKEVQVGAGPRASIAFARASKALVFLQGRDYVTAADIRKLAHPILRHRIILGPEQREMGITEDYIIKKILGKIESPLD